MTGTRRAETPEPPTLKPYTRYICPKGCWGTWTGAMSTPRTRYDGMCLLHGIPLVEEPPDDGTRWRLTWEMDTPNSTRGWHEVVKETASERDAREQHAGLLTLIAEGERVRNVRLQRAVAAWEDVLDCESCHQPITDDAEQFDCPRYSGPVHVGCHPRDCTSPECREALSEPWEE